MRGDGHALDARMRAVVSGETFSSGPASVR